MRAGILVVLNSPWEIGRSLGLFDKTDGTRRARFVQFGRRNTVPVDLPPLTPLVIS